MSKMHYCYSNKFSKIAERWGSPPSVPSFLRFWKLRDLAKLCYFKLILMKYNLKQ